MRHSVGSSRTHAHARTHTRTASRRMAALAAALMGAGSICLLTSVSASAAGSGLGGTATISDPSGVTPLASGGSTTQFTVVLPANAACEGDTANDGYHIYSYLVPEGTNVTTLTFTGNEPPTGTYGFVNNAGVYYGPVNTAVTTGQVISIPNNFEWAPLATSDGLLSTLLTGGTTPGTWEAGLLCSNSTGAVTDNWNTVVTFTASTSDPNGFVWADTPGGGTTTTTTTTTTAPTSSTTTTAPSSSTTTTTAPSSSTTTTTTTTGVAGTVAASSSTGTGSSGTGSSDPSSSGSSTPLAFTGAPITKFLGAGLLAVGVALMLLGWAHRNRRVRLARADRSSPR